MDKEMFEELREKLAGRSQEEVLRHTLKAFKGKIAFATSLGAEDQVLTDILMRIDPEVRIFTLDSGRLFNETYELLDRTVKHYNKKIEVFFPDFRLVEKMVNDHGPNLFYQSVENRKQCCYIRKVEPLQRALKGLDAWITGLRRTQSVSRQSLQVLEWDDTFQLLKVNPLCEYPEQGIWDYVTAHSVPFNVLHSSGFSSIGCAPCTRSVDPDEDVRSGRWWWEQPEGKECGLHVKERKACQ